MASELDRSIANFCNALTNGSDSLTKARIKAADYDKTLVGFVSEKKNDTWIVQTSGVAYPVKTTMSNISMVGQQVRLYIPNHDYKNMYAEVISDAGSIFVDLGDGLWLAGELKADIPDKVRYNIILDNTYCVGDIFCLYNISKHVIADDYSGVTYYFVDNSNKDKYSVEIKWNWNEETQTKTDISWKRVYPE